MKNTFPIRLKELRLKQNISQAKLGAIFSVPQQTYNCWEHGISQPSIEMLVQLANYFGVTADYLIGKG